MVHNIYSVLHGKIWLDSFIRHEAVYILRRGNNNEVHVFDLVNVFFSYRTDV